MSVANAARVQSAPWQDQLFDAVKAAGVRQMSYVPDAGHARLIQRCKDDPEIRDVVLTTEEEGVALAAGAVLVRGDVLGRGVVIGAAGAQGERAHEGDGERTGTRDLHEVSSSIGRTRSPRARRGR